MRSSNADFNLLFGMLAFQFDFIFSGDFTDAAKVSLEDESFSLDEALLRNGKLNEQQRRLLLPIVNQYLHTNGGNASRCLAATRSLGSVLEDLLDPPQQHNKATAETMEWNRHSTSIDPTIGFDDVPIGSHSQSMRKNTGTRFEILRPHARGGLGEVSVAKDLELNRFVALKEIQRQFANDEASRSRFLFEAVVTGGLEHPGIVPVYGLGQYADGRPYYAMRFIKGESLREASDHFHAKDGVRKLADFSSVDFRKLLGHFIDVCQAIDYAHSRGVLHRDLKPSNIMLGKFGETLVVDWGLARAQGNEQANDELAERFLRPETADSPERTAMGSVIGTPAFMPPEQAAGDLDQMGTASDIYSLGATLYYMLTGCAPFTGATTDILNHVRSGQFRRPRLIQPNVPKALESICMKAMQLKPQDRYATCGHLADDLEKCLADNPVSAHRDSWLTKTRRWYRKHPKSVAAIIATLLVGSLSVLVAGSVVASKNHELGLTVAKLDSVNGELKEQLDITRRAVQRADNNLQQAEQVVDDFFVLVSESDELKRGDVDSTNLRRELLSKAEIHYVQFINNNPAAGLELSLANAYDRAATAKRELGRYPEAVDGYRKAIEIWTTHPSTDSPDIRIAKARVGIAQCLRQMGDVSGSISNAKLALEHVQSESSANDPQARMEVLSALGVAYTDKGSATPQTVELMKETHQLAIELLDERPNDADRRVSFLSTKFNLAETLMEANDSDAAEVHYEDIATTAATWADEDQRAVDRHHYVYYQTSVILDRVMLYARTHRFEESIKLLSAADPLFEELVRSKPQITNYRESWANAHLQMAQIAQARVIQGTLSKQDAEASEKIAIREADSVIEICRYLNTHSTLDYTASAYIVLGTHHFLHKERSLGLEQFSNAIKIYQELVRQFPEFMEYRFDLANTHTVIGLIELMQFGNHQDALSRLERSLSIAREAGDANLTPRAATMCINTCLWFASLIDKTDPANSDRAREAVELAESFMSRLPDSEQKDTFQSQLQGLKILLGVPEDAK